MSAFFAPENAPAASDLRTPGQWDWIRSRFKPDGLRRLARANRHYADEHGEYLPDVAALAYAEWERAEKLSVALSTLGVTAPADIDRLARGLRPGTWGWVSDRLDELGVA